VPKHRRLLLGPGPAPGGRLVTDEGFFGPGSVSWQVHRETTVLFGGARALLMQAAHPLVIAGARETGFYQRNPWKRLQRTLALTYAITFGTKEEARAAAERINTVHRSVRGVDQITGLPYDAFDPDLLLWVHGCLVDSALRFEQLTVGRLDDEGRERFHREQMVAAELLALPRERIPPTVAELREWMDQVVNSGILQITDAAQEVASMFRHPPREAEWRPVLYAVSWWAFGTLPPPIREQYGIHWNLAKEVSLRGTLRWLRTVRPAIPPRYRHIMPAQLAERRVAQGSG
jgi:uncharacterized protein (DUF2236 family)